MAAWSDVGLAAASVGIGGAIGIAGTYTATRMQRTYTRQDRGEARRAARIERVAEVLGRVQTFLVDANPEPYVFKSADDVHKAHQRWQPLREELAVLSAKEPASELRDAMERIDVGVANLINGLMWIVNPEYRQAVEAELSQTGGGGAHKWNEIKQGFQDTEAAARLVLTLVHGEGNTGATSQPQPGSSSAQA